MSGEGHKYWFVKERGDGSAYYIEIQTGWDMDVKWKVDDPQLFGVLINVMLIWSKQPWCDERDSCFINFCNLQSIFHCIK